MRRLIGAALFLGALTAAVLIQKRRGDVGGTDENARFDEEQLPRATGREEINDVLESGHALPSPEAKQARAAARHVAGKNTSPEREDMFDDLSDVATSGTQGNTLGREDHNPVGPHK